VQIDYSRSKQPRVGTSNNRPADIESHVGLLSFALERELAGNTVVESTEIRIYKSHSVGIRESPTV